MNFLVKNVHTLQINVYPAQISIFYINLNASINALLDIIKIKPLSNVNNVIPPVNHARMKLIVCNAR